MKKRMRKKGGLDLSIQTIVIVVLAMTLLGLGLGFIRNQFRELGSISGDVQDQIKQQILDDLRVGNKKLSFPTGTVTLSSGDRKDLAVGVQNLEDQPINFKLRISWRDPADGTFKVLPPDSQLDAADASKGAFLWDNTEQTLALGESRVIGIAFQAPTDKNTYLYKIDIEIVPAAGTTTTGGTTPQIYDAKTFFVTVT